MPELQRPHWLESTQTQLGPPCLLSIITGQEMLTPQQPQISWGPGVLQVPNVLENNLIRDLMKPGVKYQTPPNCLDQLPNSQEGYPTEHSKVMLPTGFLWLISFLQLF